MSTVMPQPTTTTPVATEPLEVTVISHSTIVYWWPIWAVGAVLAVLTYMQHVEPAPVVGGIEVWIHPSRSVGALYTAVLLLVILMTAFAVRGTASLTLVVSLIAVALFIAYMDWWNDIFVWLGNLTIFMNFGFYVFFSGAVFLIWALAVLAFDRMEYWTFRPGQLVHHRVLGAGEQTYDTQGMAVDKVRDDLFRHWVLGLGSGDVRIATTGAKKAEFYIPNVLFVGTKLERIQRLVAMKPDERPDPLPGQVPMA